MMEYWNIGTLVSGIMGYWLNDKNHYKTVSFMPVVLNEEENP
jgi:hypothetical protein